MNVAFEHLARNYIHDFEYTLIQKSTHMDILANHIWYLGSSFQARVFLLFRQMRFMQQCVIPREDTIEEGTRDTRDSFALGYLHQKHERKIRKFGYDVSDELELLREIRRNQSPDTSELIASLMGSFDIHLVDGLGLLKKREKEIRATQPTRRISLSFEIGTFAHLGKLFEQIARRSNDNGIMLLPYLTLKYRIFFDLAKYPLETIGARLQIEQALPMKDNGSISIEDLELAISAIGRMDFERLPSALLPTRGKPSFF